VNEEAVMAKFTGKNREAAMFLGVPAKYFEDPGFCLLCGEVECECDADQSMDCLAREPWLIHGDVGYVCTVCRTNAVDAANGIDTCDECMSKR
jgi:hypothetical protein